MPEHKPTTALERSDVLAACRHVPHGGVVEVPVDFLRRVVADVERMTEALRMYRVADEAIRQAGEGECCRD